MVRRYHDIVNVLETYFDGLYHSDVGRLREAFHPKAHYVCPTDDPLRYWTMSEYFAVVEKRISPASLGQPREDIIDSITFGGPHLAFARVRCAIAPKRFTDFLTLIEAHGRWQIISKVFHYEEEARRAS